MLHRVESMCIYIYVFFFRGIKKLFERGGRDVVSGCSMDGRDGVASAFKPAPLFNMDGPDLFFFNVATVLDTAASHGVLFSRHCCRQISVV